MPDKPKIFVLSSRFPYPLERGDKLRIYHQIRSLYLYFDIYLFAINDTPVSEADLTMLKPYCKEIHCTYISKSQKVLNIIRSLFKHIPFQVGINQSSGLHNLIDAKCKEIGPALIYCQLIRMAPYAMLCRRPTAKYIDYMDAYGIGMERRANIAAKFFHWIYHTEAKRVKQYEKDIYSHFDGGSVISIQDSESLRLSQLDIVSNGIDLGFFKPLDIKPTYEIGFIGNLGYLPNIEAAKILIKEIKRIYDKNYNKTLKVLISGARPTAELLKLAKPKEIVVTGWVEDIRMSYAGCKILVAPIFNGTGQQNKVLEAMAMGVPCITTSAVNKAIGAIPDQQILIADTVESFSEKIETLLSDSTLYKKISNNGLQYVKENYHWDLVNKKLINILQKFISTQ